MVKIRQIGIAIVSAVLLSAPALAQPPSPQSGYLPVNEVPASDQLPAAPLLVAAYSFVWLALMVYLWTIWRRLGKVEADMQALEQKRRR